jgi:hypothetical protein
MNTLRVVRLCISVFLTIFTLNACQLLSQEQYIDSITLTQSIFLDTPEKYVYLTADSVLPNLKEEIGEQLKQEGIHLVQNQNSANVVLKVKTRFHGRIFSKNYEQAIEDKLSFENIEQLPKPEKEKPEYEKTSIDKLIEDPSGLIVGFMLGSAMPNPIVFAPIGMVAGVGVNSFAMNYLQKSEFVTILDVEVLEKTKKPIWFNEKKVHQKDEYGVRKYDFSEETNWKTYKTRIITRTKFGNVNLKELTARIASLVI